MTYCKGGVMQSSGKLTKIIVILVIVAIILVPMCLLGRAMIHGAVDLVGYAVTGLVS